MLKLLAKIDLSSKLVLLGIVAYMVVAGLLIHLLVIFDRAEQSGEGRSDRRNLCYGKELECEHQLQYGRSTGQEVS